MNSKKIIITVRYKSTGGAYINSYKARNGNIIFKEETETKTETKKFLKALRQNLGQDIDPITLLLPCEHKILKRYDLSRWTQPLSILRSPYQALYRFSTILSQTGQVESPSLLLLGTLLSGYTSEFFNQCVHAGKLPIRALTLDAPWEDGVTALYQKAISVLAPNLYPHSKRLSTEYIHYRMPQDFIPTTDSESPNELASFFPQWTDADEEIYKIRGKQADPIIGDSEYHLTYQNITVLIQAVHGFKIPQVENFLIANPFCAAIVVHRPRQKLHIECKIDMPKGAFIHFDLCHPVWNDMEQIIKFFLGQIYSKKQNPFPWEKIWKDAGRCVLLRGSLHHNLSTAQAHANCILVASLLAFLHALKNSKLLTESEYEKIRSLWIDVFLPVKTDTNREVSTHSQSLSRQHAVAHPRISSVEYLSIFMSILQRIYEADSGTHILDLCNTHKLWYPRYMPDGTEIYGYLTLIHSALKNHTFLCLLFRKAALIPLIQNFIDEMGYHITAKQLLLEVKNLDWAKTNLLSQNNGIYKKRMPENAQDKSTIDAVAIITDGLPFLNTSEQDESSSPENLHASCGSDAAIADEGEEEAIIEERTTTPKEALKESLIDDPDGQFNSLY